MPISRGLIVRVLALRRHHIVMVVYAPLCHGALRQCPVFQIVLIIKLIWQLLRWIKRNVVGMLEVLFVEVFSLI